MDVAVILTQIEKYDAEVERIFTLMSSVVISSRSAPFLFQMMFSDPLMSHFISMLLPTVTRVVKTLRFSSSTTVGIPVGEDTRESHVYKTIKYATPTHISYCINK